MKKLLLLLLTTSFLAGLRAQSVFSALTAVQFGDSIMISWTLKGGETCVDMFLMRSSDAKTFETVYSVGGVCGATTDQYYNYIDTTGLSSGITYYYQVIASGGVYKSEVVSIRYINAGNAQVFVYPNPVADDLLVTIDNQFTPSFLIECYTLHGELLIQTIQSVNLFTLHTQNLRAGPYLLKVTTEDGAVFGKKIIVQ